MKSFLVTCISGRGLAEAASAQFPNLMVLFMSGYTDDSIVRHGILTAGVAFLQKPYPSDSLLA